MIEETDIWQALSEVVDPEIPVVSLVEMGIIREINIQGEQVEVTITPTFSGCPALQVMQHNIKQRLHDLGVTEVAVSTQLSPAWTTDWMNDSARAKLKAFGLAPPGIHHGNVALALFDPVACPYCGSENTSLRNSWGTTPCRMIFFCNQCQQPFERFKPL